MCDRLKVKYASINKNFDKFVKNNYMIKSPVFNKIFEYMKYIKEKEKSSNNKLKWVRRALYNNFRYDLDITQEQDEKIKSLFKDK